MSEHNIETLAIHLGATNALDAWFAKLKSPLPIPHGPIAKRRVPARDVLLVATGTYREASVYVVVGVLKHARISAELDHIEFADHERFVIPILASDARTWVNPRLGKAWGGTHFYWLLEHAAEYCEGEGLRLMRLGPVKAGIAASQAGMGSRVRALYGNLESLREELEAAESNLGHVIMHADGVLAELGLPKLESDEDNATQNEEPAQ